MSERKALCEQATAKLAAFNRANQDRIRAIQNAGGTDMDPAGYNPSTETMRKMITDFDEEQRTIDSILRRIFDIEPGADATMQGSAWPDRDRWGL